MLFQKKVFKHAIAHNKYSYIYIDNNIAESIQISMHLKVSREVKAAQDKQNPSMTKTHDIMHMNYDIMHIDDK